MKCNGCNSEVADGMKFCPYCGNPMTFQQQSQQSYQQPQQGQYQQPQQPYRQPYQIQYPQNQPQQPYQGQPQGQYRQPNHGQYQQQDQDQPQQEQSQTGAILKFVEYLFYILSIVDFLLGRLGIADITGFAWSPILFVAIGAIIGQYVKHKYGITDDDEK